MLCYKSFLKFTVKNNQQNVMLHMLKYNAFIINKQCDIFTSHIFRNNLYFLNPYRNFYSISGLKRPFLRTVCCNENNTYKFESKCVYCHIPNVNNRLVRYCSDNPESQQKLTLFKRFKQMYRDYWYVLVPVHLLTSTIWFTSFYYLAKSGVDIASILEYIGAGEKLVHKLRNGNSTMGYLAIAYALYKIATPVRYTITVGGTTVSIKYLKDWGYIKPIPPKNKIKEIIVEKKEIFMEKKENLKELYQEQKQALKSDKIGFFQKLLGKLKFRRKR